MNYTRWRENDLKMVYGVMRELKNVIEMRGVSERTARSQEARRQNSPTMPKNAPPTPIRYMHHLHIPIISLVLAAYIAHNILLIITTEC